VAWDDDAAVGIAGTYVERDGKRWLISMWTDSSVRRHGVGRALVDAVVAFARDAGSSELLLEVTHGNEAALALYRSCGFEETRLGAPHADGESTQELRLVL